MANLSIRKLDDDVFVRLRDLASAHGVSMEEEVRRLLKNAVCQDIKLGDMAVHLFGEAHGVDLELPSHPAHEPIDLSS
jgi:antitoxin FitA